MSVENAVGHLRLLTDDCVVEVHIVLRVLLRLQEIIMTSALEAQRCPKTTLDTTTPATADVAGGLALFSSLGRMLRELVGEAKRDCCRPQEGRSRL